MVAWTKTSRPNHGCSRYKASRQAILWAFSNLVLQHRAAIRFIRLQASCTGGLHTCLCRAGGCAPPTPTSSAARARAKAHCPFAEYWTEALKGQRLIDDEAERGVRSWNASSPPADAPIATTGNAQRLADSCQERARLFFGAVVSPFAVWGLVIISIRNFVCRSTASAVSGAAPAPNRY